MAVPGSSKNIPPLTPGAERMMDLFVRPMTTLNVWAFKLSGGRIGSRFSHGAPVCLLTTTGRKSGKQRTTTQRTLSIRSSRRSARRRAGRQTAGTLTTAVSKLPCATDTAW